MHPLVSGLRARMAAAADPRQAAAMQAYMKSDQPFYGIQAGPRRRIFRECYRSHPITTRDDYESVIRTLWQGAYREEMYQALEVAERVKAYRDLAAWPLFEYLVCTSPHWDTLDWVAAKLVGPLVREHRELEAALRDWARHPNFWVRRASLLAHLHHKGDTNLQLLGETILLLDHEKEFFIRKAIGWVLRQLAYTDGDWVRAFVARYGDRLSPLSRREALRNLN